MTITFTDVECRVEDRQAERHAHLHLAHLAHHIVTRRKRIVEQMVVQIGLRLLQRVHEPVQSLGVALAYQLRQPRV